MQATQAHQVAAQHPEPSPEQLLLAYRHLARPGWPTTVDAAMAKQSYRVAILGLARNLHRRTWAGVTGTATHLPSAPVPPTPCEPFANSHRPLGSIARGPVRPISSWTSATKTGAHDCKRAAANDKDD